MSICIITDSVATFPATSIGHRNLQIVMPRSEKGIPQLPTAGDFLRTFNSVNHDMLVLAASSDILPGFEIASHAADQHGGTNHITVIDSRQIGAGLGYLALSACQVALTGLSLNELETHVRASIGDIYTMIAINAGARDENTEESADGTSIYSIDDGQLSFFKKVRTRRHLLETFQEFLDEFEHPRGIAFAQGPDGSLRSRPLRELSASLFPGVSFSEQDFPALLLPIYGSGSACLTVYEPGG